MNDKIFELENVYLEKITKNGIAHILNNISFSVSQGEFICIMGPTGCGKSSLMKLLGGLDFCTSGTVNIFGKNPTEKNAITKEMLREIGTAFQSDNLFEWETVEKNIRKPIDVFGLKKEFDVKARTEEMLNLTGLIKSRMCYPHELSGGMRQRCSFGRALVHNPKVLLLDQPFGALDAITRKILGIELVKIHEKDKKTVVMVTNSIPEALMLADRIIVLSSCPATITHEIKVDFTYEQRLSDMTENTEYQDLYEKLNKYVHVRKQ